MLPDPEFFGIAISWYSFFPKLGLLVTLGFCFWHGSKKSGFRLSLLQIAGLFLLLYVLMVGGGRIVGVLEIYLRDGYWPDFSIIFKGPMAGGFRWCGSLLAVLLFLPCLSKNVLKIRSFNALFDLLALCFCIFTIFMKQACQFSGDGCYGLPTNLPWGMYYPYGNAPNILPVHPTPVYDSLFHLIFFALLLHWDLKWKKRAGQSAGIYFMVVPIFYILLETIRLNPVLAYGITLPQAVYALILLAWAPVFGAHWEFGCFPSLAKRWGISGGGTPAK